ncbi:MAG TPA: hypothetical protein PLC47_05440 [Bacteroidales bacterium]|nr:hypothetical protein [Bacteroidales bacterium]
MINTVTEDHESNEYEFPAGVFYTYQFEGDQPAYGFDEEDIVEKLVSKGIDVKNMWYKAASSSCVPPGSEMAMSVMVEAVLLVQLKETDDQLLRMQFERASAPSMGSCAYRVKRYLFQPR